MDVAIVLRFMVQAHPATKSNNATARTPGAIGIVAMTAAPSTNPSARMELASRYLRNRDVDRPPITAPHPMHPTSAPYPLDPRSSDRVTRRGSSANIATMEEVNQKARIIRLRIVGE